MSARGSRRRLRLLGRTSTTSQMQGVPYEPSRSAARGEGLGTEDNNKTNPLKTMTIPSVAPGSRDGEEPRGWALRTRIRRSKKREARLGKKNGKNKGQQQGEGIKGSDPNAKGNVDNEQASPSGVVDVLPFFQEEDATEKERGAADLFSTPFALECNGRVGAEGRDDCKGTSFDVAVDFGELFSSATPPTNDPKGQLKPAHPAYFEKTDPKLGSILASLQSGPNSGISGTPLKSKVLEREGEDPPEEYLQKAAEPKASAQFGDPPRRNEGNAEKLKSALRKDKDERKSMPLAKITVVEPGAKHGEREVPIPSLVDWGTPDKESEESTLRDDELSTVPSMVRFSEGNIRKPSKARFKEADVISLRDDMSTVPSMMTFSVGSLRRPIRSLDVCGVHVPDRATGIADVVMDGLATWFRILSGLPAPNDESFDSQALDGRWVEEGATLIKSLKKELKAIKNSKPQEDMAAKMDALKSELETLKLQRNQMIEGEPENIQTLDDMSSGLYSSTSLSCSSSSSGMEEKMDKLLSEKELVQLALGLECDVDKENSVEDFEALRGKVNVAKASGIQVEPNEVKNESSDAKVLGLKEDKVCLEAVMSLRHLASTWEAEAEAMRRKLAETVAERDNLLDEMGEKDKEIEALHQELEKARASKERDQIRIAQRAQFLDTIWNLKCRSELMLKGEGSDSLEEAGIKEEEMVLVVEADQHDAKPHQSKLVAVEVDRDVKIKDSTCTDDQEEKADDKKILMVQNQEFHETFENLFSKNDHAHFLETSMCEAIEEQNLLASKITYLKDVVRGPWEEEEELLQGLMSSLEIGHMCAQARVEDDNIEAMQELETLKQEMVTRIESFLKEMATARACTRGTCAGLDEMRVLARRQHEWLQAMALVLGSLSSELELARS